MRNRKGEPITPGGLMPLGMCQPPVSVMALIDRLSPEEANRIVRLVAIWAPELLEKGLQRVSEHRAVVAEVERERAAARPEWLYGSGCCEHWAPEDECSQHTGSPAMSLRARELDRPGEAGHRGEQPGPECDVCAGPREERGCDGQDEDCPSCGGSGWRIPLHCCNCGGAEYGCICCPKCGAQDIGKCPCTVTVQTRDGGTLDLPPGGAR